MGHIMNNLVFEDEGVSHNLSTFTSGLLPSDRFICVVLCCLYIRVLLKSNDIRKLAGKEKCIIKVM